MGKYGKTVSIKFLGNKILKNKLKLQKKYTFPGYF